MAYAPKLLTFTADQPRLSRLICFVLGAATTLSFAPFGLSYLTLLVLLPILFVCVTTAPRDAAWHLFWYGLGLFLSGTYWIYISVVVFGEAPTWIALFLMVGLALIMSLWLFLTGYLISRLAAGEPWLLLIVAPAAWVLVEWARGWVLSGFPWLAFGYAHVDSAFGGWAPVVGIYGVSFMVVLSASALLVAIMRGGRQRLIAVAVVLAPWLMGSGLGLVDWTRPDGEPLRATLLQFGISQDKKWDRESRQPTLDYYRDSTRVARDSDIVIWPEVAVPSLTSYEAAYIGQLQSDARESGQTILFGILEDEVVRGKEKIYNSVLLLDGRRLQVYRKRHLVPFGEYFPVPDTVREWMKMLSLPHSDLSPGADRQPLLTTRSGVALGTAICYEDAYGAEQRYALPAAGVLINVSNDAWFGDSIAPHQHLQIARMRSLEFGRPTLRATNTGISAFIDHRGKLTRTGPQHEETKLTDMVQPRTGATPYVATGNTPILILCILMLGATWLNRRR
ncbi:MAG: apolipoprotein N-acyltransferase [Woeseiaceae bacterium]|nr:apolipoprotein N-acyltransferase [Woeseiaceae bacterium]